MASYEITTWMNKFLKKLGTDAPEDTGLNSDDQLALRALIDAASTAAVNLKQNANDDLTNYADAADAAARRTLIGAAPLVSPVFSGNPAITTTPATGNNSALIANTAYVDSAAGVLNWEGNPNTNTVQASGSTSPAYANGTFSRQSATFYGTNTGQPGFYWETGGTSRWTFKDQIAGPNSQERWLGVDAGVTVTVPDPVSPALDTFVSANASTGTYVVAVAPFPATHYGQIYRDTTNSKWYIWNGTLWDELTITAP